MTETVGYRGVKVPRSPSTRGVLFIRNLPASIKNLFKSVVVRRGDTMERVVRELVLKYTEDPECIDRWERKRRKKRRKKS